MAIEHEPPPVYVVSVDTDSDDGTISYNKDRPDPPSSGSSSSASNRFGSGSSSRSAGGAMTSRRENSSHHRTSKFNRVWLEDYPWLKYIEGKGTFCKLCQKHKKLVHTKKGIF